MHTVTHLSGLPCVRQRTDCAGAFDQTVFHGSTFESLAVAIMRRLALVLVLVGMAAAAHAARPDNDFFVPKLDLLTVQTVEFDANGLARTSRYRFTASIVAIASVDTGPFGFEFSNTSHLTPAGGRQKEIDWTTNSELSRFLGSDRASLTPRLRIESAGQRIEIVPRRHSVWIQWRKTLQ